MRCQGAPLTARPIHAVILDLSCYPTELAIKPEATEARPRYELSQATHYRETPDGIPRSVEAMLVTTGRRDTGDDYLPREDRADPKPNHSWRTLLKAN